MTAACRHLQMRLHLTGQRQVPPACTAFIPGRAAPAQAYPLLSAIAPGQSAGPTACVRWSSSSRPLSTAACVKAGPSRPGGGGTCRAVSGKHSERQASRRCLCPRSIKLRKSCPTSSTVLCRQVTLRRQVATNLLQGLLQPCHSQRASIRHRLCRSTAAAGAGDAAAAAASTGVPRLLQGPQVALPLVLNGGAVAQDCLCRQLRGR